MTARAWIYLGLSTAVWWLAVWLLYVPGLQSIWHIMLVGHAPGVGDISRDAVWRMLVLFFIVRLVTSDYTPSREGDDEERYAASLAFNISRAVVFSLVWLVMAHL